MSAISENTATCFPETASYSNARERRALCIYVTSVTLRIESLAGEHGTILKLIGRIQAEHLDELRGANRGQRIEGAGTEGSDAGGCGGGPVPGQLRDRRHPTAELFSVHTRVDRQGKRERLTRKIRTSILNAQRSKEFAMKNPVVLITGALTGIGRATALAFAHEGARIVVSGRHDDTATH